MQDEPDEKPKIWLNRRKAALYLEARYGAKIAPATLAKMAVRGNGPPFAYMGPYCVYTPEYLDAWAESRLSAKVSSTAGRNNPRDPFRRRGRPKSPFATRAECRTSTSLRSKFGRSLLTSPACAKRTKGHRKLN
jgi:hypothetical protein